MEPARPGLPGAAKVAGPVEVELPPWPGRLPSPSPTVVHAKVIRADVVDALGEQIGVTARCMPTASPAKVRFANKRWTDVVAWTGPWPVDERWWDADARSRKARFQVTLADGTAHLLTLEEGTFRVEATYD